MVKVNAIKALARRGWSQRRISETLEINRRTVARYLSEEDSNCTTALTGPGADPTPAMRVPSSGLSACEPFREMIIEMLELRLSATPIYQDLTRDHGYTGSYYSVMRFVRRLHQKHELPFRRLESSPGEEAQVDFGSGAPVIDADGRRRKTHVLRAVLSHCRKGYSEAVFRQTTVNFIQCLENAFDHFGGVPKTLVIDNLKAAVTKADWYDPELNPKLESFARH